MVGQELISIQMPDIDTDWFIIRTDKLSYDLKLGGVVRTSSVSSGPYIQLPFDKAKITRVLTDNFTTYIELDNDYCIVHSDTFINADGQTSFEIYIHNKDYYQNDGGLEGMFPIKIYD